MKKAVKRKILFISFMAVSIFGITNVDAATVSNTNIVKAYTYGASCVTGDESTCVETTCYQNKAVGSCPAGTIIEYRVNDTTTKKFHVLYDDINTMTLYETTTSVTGNFYGSNETEMNTSLGPVVALNNLNNYTKDWKNVSDITYQMGVTKFFDNSFTDCSNTGCSANTYQWDKPITAKSRLLTVQEATHLGCSFALSSSKCPSYLYSNSQNGSLLMNSSGNTAELFIWKESNVIYIQGDNTLQARDLRAVTVINKETVVAESNAEEVKTDDNKKGSQIVAVKDTLKKAYVGYCIGTIVLILGIMVIYQTYRKDKKEITVKSK